MGKQAELRSTTILLCILAVVFVGLRLLARWKKGIGVLAEDWIMLLSCVFMFATMAVDLLMISYGLGLHASELTNEQRMSLGKSLMAFECVYCTSNTIIKISLLVMYNRIFPVRSFRIMSYFLGFCAIGWGIAINCVSVFQCAPIAKAWNPTLAGHCINLKASFIANAVPNMLTDIAILALPIPHVWGLKATVMHRLSLIFMFLLGSFVVFAGIYRFTTIFQFDPNDTSYTLATACTWCVVEVASGIISACLPTLRPLLNMVSQSFGWSRAEKSHNATSGTRPDLVTIGGHTVNGGRPKPGMKPGQRVAPFQRLDDGMRPIHGADSSTEVIVNKSMHFNDSSDDVPLNVIQVRTEFDWADNDGQQYKGHEHV